MEGFATYFRNFFHRQKQALFRAPPSQYFQPFFGNYAGLLNAIRFGFSGCFSL